VTPLVNVLLPVVVGGLMTALGGFLVAYFLQRKKDAAEKKSKRAQKFEELVGAVYEYDHWIDTTRNIRVFGSQGEIAVSPFAKIHAISDTYFPELERGVGELWATGHTYETWMLDVAQNRPQNDALLAGHEPIVSLYVEKREALLTGLRNVARREFQ
jgi:hypothetical protein